MRNREREEFIVECFIHKLFVWLGSKTDKKHKIWEENSRRENEIEMMVKVLKWGELGMKRKGQFEDTETNQFRIV